ncbi:MAG TPA: DUF72 domain-containing protein [Caulobacterales bacterium]|nr:DUF72 domain-containing protein [Caulobacterales bacterium]
MIRAGIGGWTFEPWRGTFYPDKLPAARELEYAASKLTSIEINGTFYRTQSPASFKSWAKQTPDDFVFSVKAHRSAVNRKDLREAAESIEFFLKSGVTGLAEKLGPILWQMTPYKKFDADEFDAFFALLPEQYDGRTLRHAIEVRHASFADAAFVELARKHNVAIVCVESDKHAPIADATADFIYLRLEKTRAAEPTGYSKDELKTWLTRARAWEKGETPKDLAQFSPAKKAPPREVFAYFISGAKERAPAAAMAFIALADAKK